MGPVKRRPALTFVAEFQGTETCVGMVEWKGKIYVATTKRVYMLVDDKLIPLKIQEAIDETN